MITQTAMIIHLQQAITTLPSVDHLNQVLATLQAQMQQEQHIRAMQQSLEALNNKFASWETIYLGTAQEPPTRTTCLKSAGSTPPICTAIRPPFATLCLAGF